MQDMNKGGEPAKKNPLQVGIGGDVGLPTNGMPKATEANNGCHKDEERLGAELSLGAGQWAERPEDSQSQSLPVQAVWSAGLWTESWDQLWRRIFAEVLQLRVKQLNVNLKEREERNG